MRQIFFVILFASSLNSFAQIKEGGTYQFFTCKDRTETYVYYGGTTDPGKIYCMVNWSVVGGVFIDSNNATTTSTYTDSNNGTSSVRVKWTTDNPTGTISVSTNTCSNGDSNKTITFKNNPTTLTASPSTVNFGAQTTLNASSSGPANSYTWSSPTGGNLNQTTGSSVTANPTITTTFTCTVNSTFILESNFQTVKTIACNQKNTVRVTVRPSISNNVISNSAGSIFYGTGDPTILTGSIPTGGTGIYSYQWQSSTSGETSGFSNITSATNANYDPSTISQTTYYRRLVTSGSISNTSNVITITIVPLGLSFDYPINIGDVGIGSNYSSPLEPRGYYYKFNLTTSAAIRLLNCKTDGVSGTFNLFDANRSLVQGGPPMPACDVGYEVNYNLQPGVYYIVTEGSPTVWTNIYLYVTPICSIVTTSPNVTINGGSSTVLSASGTDTYTWSPATGLSSTTGASVTASPMVTTTYTVFARRSDNYCGVYKSIVVTVAGSIGSTINNPIVANIGGCGYTSPFPFLTTTGYGNEYGSPAEDIFFKFTLSNPSEVYIYSNYSDVYLEGGLRVVLLNNAGTFIDEQYFGWIDSGDDAGSYFYGELDRTPLKPTLQAGSYYVVVEGTNGTKDVAIGIETPSGYSCRKAMNPTPIPTKKETENQNNDQSKLGRVTIYPNPANQSVSFNIDPIISATVYFININGITVKEITIAGKSVTSSVSDLPTGLYHIRIIQGDKVSTQKILIER